MAENFDFHTVSANIGALNNANRPIFKLPTEGGGVTVLACHALFGGAGTAALNLVDMGIAGTSVSGTIATKGSAAYTANTPMAFTVSTGFVDAGHWIGVQETNVGTCNVVSIVAISYVHGK
jgi:L-2-hydroxyglutarate oxidase LhgO